MRDACQDALRSLRAVGFQLYEELDELARPIEEAIAETEPARPVLDSADALRVVAGGARRGNPGPPPRAAQGG